MMARSLVKFALIGVLNISACILGVLVYYGYGKLALPGYFCGPFGAIDAQLGWVIAPNATSCIGARAPFSSDAPWFEAPVFTDANGFRSAQSGSETPRGGVLFVGDSWTFGYGVTFEQSFPGQFQARTGVPAVVAASPAYGSAQALMLAERWIDRLSPRAIVYLDLGLWERSACRGSHRPTAITKPCYWQKPGSRTAELVVPPPGTVEKFASWGVMPGGMLGAGENTWSYFLWSRPITQAEQVLVRVGLMAGFGHDFRAVGVDENAIRDGVFEHILRMAARTRVPVLLIDPADVYDSEFGARPPKQRGNLHRIGALAWNQEVSAPSSKLAAELAGVPHDGHFGPGTNALVAALVEQQLRTLGAGL